MKGRYVPHLVHLERYILQPFDKRIQVFLRVMMNTECVLSFEVKQGPCSPQANHQSYNSNVVKNKRDVRIKITNFHNSELSKNSK